MIIFEFDKADMGVTQAPYVISAVSLILIE